MKWEKARKRICENPAVLEEIKNNEGEYKIINEIIKARKEKNITQKDLPELIGTRQSNISRLESGNYNPTLDFLGKIAAAMGKHLEIKIV